MSSWCVWGLSSSSKCSWLHWLFSVRCSDIRSSKTCVQLAANGLHVWKISPSTSSCEGASILRLVKPLWFHSSVTFLSFMSSFSSISKFFSRFCFLVFEVSKFFNFCFSSVSCGGSFSLVVFLALLLKLVWASCSEFWVYDGGMELSILSRKN